MGTLSAAPFNVGGAEQIVGAEHVSGAEHEHFDAAAACSGRLKRPPAPSSSQSRQQSEQQSEQQPRKRKQRLVQCKRRRRAGSSTGGASSTAKQTRLLGADGGHANHKRAAGAASEAFNRKLGDDVERLAAIAQRSKRFNWGEAPPPPTSMQGWSRPTPFKIPPMGKTKAFYTQWMQEQKWRYQPQQPQQKQQRR